VDKFFKPLAKLVKILTTRQVRKQPAKNIVRVSERDKNPRQTGEWVCIFTSQSWILLAFGKLVSGYTHPCLLAFQLWEPKFGCWSMYYGFEKGCCDHWNTTTPEQTWWQRAQYICMDQNATNYLCDWFFFLQKLQILWIWTLMLPCTLMTLQNFWRKQQTDVIYIFFVSAHYF
jgi:hypothetical protein